MRPVSHHSGCSINGPMTFVEMRNKYQPRERVEGDRNKHGRKKKRGERSIVCVCVCTPHSVTMCAKKKEREPVGKDYRSA